MLISEVLETAIVVEYTLSDFTTVTLMEEEGDWVVEQSNAFKKGMKKYKHNKRVTRGIDSLRAFVTSHDSNPPTRSYPVEYNVHSISFQKNYPNSMWAHLEGQKIGLIFSVTGANQPGDKNVLSLLFVGTHQDLGWK